MIVSKVLEVIIVGGDAGRRRAAVRWQNGCDIGVEYTDESYCRTLRDVPAALLSPLNLRWRWKRLDGPANEPVTAKAPIARRSVVNKGLRLRMSAW